jgi:hypothetical protein
MKPRAATAARTLAETSVWPGIRHAFWNVRDPGGMALDKYASLIIARVLEYGDSAQLRWIRDAYGDDRVGEVVMCSREVSRRTAVLWRNLLGLEGESRAEALYRELGPLYWGRT